MEYIQFMYCIYDHHDKNGAMGPYNHPIEIYIDKQTEQRENRGNKNKHCKDDNGDYDGCFDLLKDIHNELYEKMGGNNNFTEYWRFVHYMTNNLNVKNKYELLWVKAYLYMFEPGQTAPNLEDDSIFLGIAKQFKHCLFTRKIIEK